MEENPQIPNNNYTMGRVFGKTPQQTDGFRPERPQLGCEASNGRSGSPGIIWTLQKASKGCLAGETIQRMVYSPVSIGHLIGSWKKKGRLSKNDLKRWSMVEKRSKNAARAVALREGHSRATTTPKLNAATAGKAEATSVATSDKHGVVGASLASCSELAGLHLCQLLNHLDEQSPTGLSDLRTTTRCSTTLRNIHRLAVLSDSFCAVFFQLWKPTGLSEVRTTTRCSASLRNIHRLAVLSDSFCAVFFFNFGNRLACPKYELRPVAQPP
ncbi:hypothetical protein PGTUg99_031057 [Puccinia graminis f. sp. tritici]|uniref:Uncharacterized protein n=1 Tax=Puccinia graminis f. sp. tritici TaxID=56615 RepID=A0A5B0SCU1_PUCGR|nr:hypothetical protein PGTUg99_031057 [Puccinia graminis f. sp. tritici]